MSTFEHALAIVVVLFAPACVVTPAAEGVPAETNAGAVAIAKAVPRESPFRVELGDAVLRIPSDAPVVLSDMKGKTCAADADCDDGNACTRDACDAKTHTCSSKLIDEDGDGYAPSSLGACGLDCDDTNALVHPKQEMYFSEPYVTASGAKSFDYDCDGSARIERESKGYCIGFAGEGESSCKCVPGWLEEETPGCGVEGWYTETTTCGPSATVKRSQRCH